MPMTPEQLKMILSMSENDIGGMEDEQAQMARLAEGLRGNIRPVQRGNDVGQNIGNAGFGIAGALNDYRAQKLAPQITDARKLGFRNLIQSMNGVRQAVKDPYEE